MAALEEPILPNIRVEIKNNLTELEEMDVEEENEDGEILDDEDEDIIMGNEKLSHKNINQDELRSRGIFTTGFDIFDKEAQIKLEERARRFALKPEEIHKFTDSDLEELYVSLGITSDTERITRFDTVYIYGTAGLSTEDILQYFAKYAPTYIEWIDDDTCNVRWFENITAARAMFYSSKAVNGMPVREPVNTFAKEFIDDIEDPEENTGESILLKNRGALKDVLPKKVRLKNAVDITEITIPIPPGYWRLGQKHPKAKCLLLRYSFKTDKKPCEITDLARYYKNLGTTRISQETSDLEGKGLFERNRDLKQIKNPWGSLAKNWNRDKKFCEPDPNKPAPEIEIMNPRLLVRLGKKRVIENNEEEETKIEEETEKKSRLMPRMRMYADEEEERQRRRRALMKLKKTEQLAKENVLLTKDLRNVLRHPAEIVDLIEPEASLDLGAKLKNRTQRMVFTLKRESDEEIDERDARRVLLARRRGPASGSHRDSRRSPGRSYSPYKREDTQERYPSAEGRLPLGSRRRHSPHRSSHHSIHRGRMRSDFMEDQKPRSKVAVVIKKPKQPAVASTIWSKVKSQSESESSSEESQESSESEDSSSSEGSESASESESSEESSGSEQRSRGRLQRPGFTSGDARARIREAPLKITMKNEHYKRK